MNDSSEEHNGIKLVFRIAIQTIDFYPIKHDELIEDDLRRNYAVNIVCPPDTLQLIHLTDTHLHTTLNPSAHVQSYLGLVAELWPLPTSPDTDLNRQAHISKNLDLETRVDKAICRPMAQRYNT